MGRLVRDDRNATVTKITTRYNQGKHHRGPYLDYSHTVSRDEGPPASLLPKASEEIRSELKNPQTVLQLHCVEHPDWLHHHLVWRLHCSQPESPA